MGLRQIKILFAALTALYMIMVTFNNLVDYPSNFAFVQAVFSMSDVFSGQTNKWRSIDDGTLHHVAYLFIIAVEMTTAVLLSVGAIRMFRARGGEVNKFHGAGKLVSAGLAIGVTLWFGMFLTIGGEWFLMWQSEKWNAQDNAFSLATVFLLFLVIHQRHDR